MDNYSKLLKDCYILASESCQDELSRNQITKKIDGISKEELPVDINFEKSVPYMPTQILSEALLELSESNSEINRRIVSDKQSEVQMLPPSGEKEYILALYALQNGISDDNTNLVYSHISAALSSSEKALLDPRYRALADLIQDLKRK